MANAPSGTPESDKQRDTQKTVGVYDRPKQKTPTPLLIILIIIALIVLVVMLIKFASGGTETQPSPDQNHRTTNTAALLAPQSLSHSQLFLRNFFQDNPNVP
jgi:flagellar basal body-associated protein FliL